MLYDANGRKIRTGQTVQELSWHPGADTSLPNWLVAVGVSPELTFNSPGVLNGSNLQLKTKSATPAAGDVAGISTAFNIDSRNYSEICFSICGIKNDSGTTAANAQLQMQYFDGANAGCIIQSNNANAGISQVRTWPDAADNSEFSLLTAVNALQNKSVGILIKPKTREVYYFSGDPENDASVMDYKRGVWSDTIAPFIFQLKTQSAAQRSMTIDKVKLSLCKY